MAQLRRYRKFCEQFNFKPFPCPASRATIYATYLSNSIKPVSIRNYMSAIWYYHKMHGLPEFSSDFLLKQTLNGIERTLCNREKLGKYPITVDDLLAMHTLLDMSVTEDCIFWIAVIMCFRGLLRKSHVTCSPHALNVCDVRISPECIKLRIKSSKTDQFGLHPFTICLMRVPGSPLCPGDLLERILTPPVHHECLLTLKVGRIYTPLSYSYFNSRLKSLASTLGLPVHRVSSHSLRHGGATLLKSLGVSVGDIMLRGNWRSKAVSRYLHQSECEMKKLDAKPCEYFASLM